MKYLVIKIANFGNEYSVFRVISSEKENDKTYSISEMVVYKAEHLYLSLSEAIEETKRLLEKYKLDKKEISLFPSGGISLAFKDALEKL